MLDSQEFSPIASSSEKSNYTSKRRNNRRKKTNRKSSNKKKSYSLPSLDNNNYLDNIKKILGGAKKMSAEEICWFIFMAVMIIIFLLRHLANKEGNWVNNYIANWFDTSVKPRNECSDGIFMCAVKDIISGFGKSNKETKAKLYHLLTLILIVLFTTELWMHMLRTLSKSENAAHPKFCLLGIRCFM
tara:strand:+ start:624 stop:1184 length:561 start_codon:yes stop_codon:yes gene_type:complete